MNKFPARNYSRYHASVEVWTSILTLALRWGFVEVKALAFRELEYLVPIETLALSVG